MAHLLSSGGSLCQICGKNPKTKKIHDKEKIIWIHDDARVLEVVNRGLKIGRSSTSATGALGAVGVAGGRMAYKGKIGKRTGGALMAVGGAFALADGIMGIIDAATAEIPQERCRSCSRVLSSYGCEAMCMGAGGCGGRCKNNNWKMAADEDLYCYHICDQCFGKLIG